MQTEKVLIELYGEKVNQNNSNLLKADVGAVIFPISFTQIMQTV